MELRYPYHEWNVLTADEARLTSAVARTVGAPEVAHAQEQLRQITGLAWAFRLDARVTDYLPRGECLRVDFESNTGDRISIDVDPALARFLMERVLGAETVTMPSRPTLLTDVEAGILLYLAARLPHANGPYCVRDCRVERSPDGTHRGETFLTTLHVGAATGWCRFHFAEANKSIDLNLAQRAIPMTARIDAGLGLFRRSAIRELTHGDIVFMNPCWLRSLDPLSGLVRLQLVGDGSRCWCLQLDQGMLRFEQTQEVPMATNKQTLEDNRSAPVEVCIELTRFTVPLATLSALAPGEILETGTPVGHDVLLRAGDEVLAEGELVSVDGEIGVKIRARR